MQGATAIAPKSEDVRRVAFAALGVVLCFGVAGCSAKSKVESRANLNPSAVAAVEEPDAAEAAKDKGRPVKIAGASSAIESFENYSAEGLSSWYGSAFHGRRTANGEIFDMGTLTAAHPSMPLPSYARVTNINNGKSVIVRVNDRGPFHGNRALDVSQRTAELLGFKNHGMARVKIDYVGSASLKGSDDAKLMATYRENGPSSEPVAVASLDLGPDAPGSASGLRGPMLASLAPEKSTAAPAPEADSPVSAQSNNPVPAQAATTTPVDIASRIQTSFGSMSTPQPLTGTQRPQMVQPVLSGFAFEPSTLTKQR